MISQRILTCAIAVALSPATFAQNPPVKPPPKATLVRPASASPAPPRPAAPKSTPTPKSTPVPASTPAPAPAPLTDPGPSEPAKPGEEAKDKAPEKKAKEPTIITSVQATFDQKANVAVFIDNVLVVDPEFTIHCDKLTAYLKHNDPPKPPAAPAPPGKPGVKPVATPAPKPDAKGEGTPDDAAPKKKGTGLDKALAEASPGKRVLINQDKVETDGTITHGIGRADWATYDTLTGDVVLHGTPEVIQGPKSVVAIDPDAVITLNRDGRMHAVGLTRTTVDNTGDR